MSRTLKFRAWDNANKIYLRRIVNISYDMAGQLHHVDGEHPNRSDITVLYDKLLLEQYTGLKDKDGKEIYEKDIVEYDWYIVGNKPAYRVNSVVDFDYKGAMVGNDRLWKCTNIEVIGNVHENPELLGAKNE